MVEFFLIRKTESNNTFSQGTQQTKTGFQINPKYGKMSGYLDEPRKILTHE
jgi:hypothetical protein